MLAGRKLVPVKGLAPLSPAYETSALLFKLYRHYKLVRSGTVAVPPYPVKGRVPVYCGFKRIGAPTQSCTEFTSLPRTCITTNALGAVKLEHMAGFAPA